MGILDDLSYAFGFTAGPTPAQDTAFGVQRGGPGPGEFLDDPLSSLARAGGFSVGLTPEEDTAFGVKRGGPGLAQAAHEFFMGRPEVPSQPQQKGPKAPSGVTGQYRATHPEVIDAQVPPEWMNTPPPGEGSHYKLGKSPREKELASQGYTNYAPGVSYKMGTPESGKTFAKGSAFGKEYDIPMGMLEGSGNSSMMEVSGNTPMAEELLQRQRQKQLESAAFGPALAEASLTPQQRAAMTQKPDVRMEAWRTGIEIETRRIQAEAEAEARFIAALQAKSPGAQPLPADIDEVRKRAGAPYEKLAELAKAGITQDRPGLGESIR